MTGATIVLRKHLHNSGLKADSNFLRKAVEMLALEKMLWKISLKDRPQHDQTAPLKPQRANQRDDFAPVRSTRVPNLPE